MLVSNKFTTANEVGRWSLLSQRGQSFKALSFQMFFLNGSVVFYSAPAELV